MKVKVYLLIMNTPSHYTYFWGLRVSPKPRTFATSDLNELVSHNYVTTFMKNKRNPRFPMRHREAGNFFINGHYNLMSSSATSLLTMA